MSRMTTHGVASALRATLMVVTESAASNTNTPTNSNTTATAAASTVVCTRRIRGHSDSMSRPLA